MNLPSDLRRKWEKEILPKDDETFMSEIEMIRTAMIKRIELSSQMDDAAMNFSKCVMKPGEKMVDFAGRVERCARAISNGIHDEAIDQMMIGRIADSLPIDAGAVLRSFDLSDTDSVMRKAQTLSDGMGTRETVCAVGSTNDLLANIQRLEEELTHLRVSKDRSPTSTEVCCRKCGCRSHFTKDCDGRVTCYRCRKKGTHCQILPEWDIRQEPPQECRRPWRGKQPGHDDVHSRPRGKAFRGFGRFWVTQISDKIR
ncbi:hypothetical protein RF11_01027 [Thelohanellus kitauei]|uniref:CCHC-type domain-containing protein n=1 Tax=Thelohanellus kitauei TaxID=669202 RepID=A0A0C2NH21_THEKT|nr:hypothetical protein RF11_01027 [Thelohanellus kitauei]